MIAGITHEMEKGSWFCSVYRFELLKRNIEHFPKSDHVSPCATYIPIACRPLTS